MKTKSTALLLLMLLSLKAFAEPVDQDEVTKLGIGSEIVVTQNMNFPAGTTKWSFSQEDYTCTLFLNVDMDYDRELPQGTVLKINAIKPSITPDQNPLFNRNPDLQCDYVNDYSYDILLTQDDGQKSSVSKLTCSGPRSTCYDDKIVAIGDLKSLTKNYLAIKLAAPVYIK